MRSDCRISSAVARCSATEMRCATNVVHVRADQVVSSYSSWESRSARMSAASRSSGHYVAGRRTLWLHDA